MLKFSLIKTILILIICINFQTANRYVEAIRDIEYGVKFSGDQNHSVNKNIEEKTTRRSSSSSSILYDNYSVKSELQNYSTALDNVELIPLTETDLSSSSSSSSIDERSNRSSSKLKTYENLSEAEVFENLKKSKGKILSSVSDEVIDRSERGRLTLADIEGPSISEDVENLGDESMRDSVHVRVKRDNLFRDPDEIVREGREIFRLKKDDEISLNDPKALPRRSAAASLLIRRKRFDRENFPSTKYSEAELIIPRKIRKFSDEEESVRIVRGGRKKNRGKSRKHKHRKKPKNGRHYKKPSKLSTRGDFGSKDNLKHRWKPPAFLVGGKPELGKGFSVEDGWNIAEDGNRGGENIVRIKRDKDVLEKSGKLCQKDRIKSEDLNYYEDVKEAKRFKRGKRVNRGRKSLNRRGKIGKKYLAKKSVKDIKNLLSQLTGKVNELQGFYVGENKDGGVKEAERFKRGKKPATRCVECDSKNLTKPEDKTVGLKSKLETDISGVVKEEEKSNNREERKISSNDAKKNYPNKSSLENNRRKRKPRRKWDRWTDWSSCSVTCGKGRQIRWRHCVHDCTLAETEMEEKTCQLPACGPGKFLGIF